MNYNDNQFKEYLSYKLSNNTDKIKWLEYFTITQIQIVWLSGRKSILLIKNIEKYYKKWKLHTKLVKFMK